MRAYKSLVSLGVMLTIAQDAATSLTQSRSGLLVQFDPLNAS